MNFLEKLNMLMEKNNLNKNTLSKYCGIPYTTIDGWYKRGYDGLKLTTIRKLSNYFNVSLDFWVNEETENLILNEQEKILIINFRKYNELQPAIKKLLDI